MFSLMFLLLPRLASPVTLAVRADARDVIPIYLSLTGGRGCSSTGFCQGQALRNALLSAELGTQSGALEFLLRS